MSVLATIGALALKHGETAFKVYEAVELWATSRRTERLEILLRYVNHKASGFNLPANFNQQEEFEDFAAAVFDAASRSANNGKIQLLAYVLLNEGLAGSEVSYEVKTKIQELLLLVQVHHIELLKIIHTHSVMPFTAQTAASEVKDITEFEGSLHTLRKLSSADQRDLYYSAVSDLLRWYLIRSTVDTGVNIARAAAFIPGTGMMGFVRTTQLGGQFLRYVRDPNGAFIDLSALNSEVNGEERNEQRSSSGE